ncbi:EGF-like repeat and discoidin I-like domain-containing protein 3 [Actinia tenebrosa]|uniref:EGF-like repeat and discoidin I-like domain-containing protein 3 n=1 Tax=Actinia tenebrosa TaxID=6105 RepID=A0A6P8JB25_ACTTE|nr:EGF-like repeat and discoidin I-like domain-containing protein 3 [Actinia tenebrosa]
MRLELYGRRYGRLPRPRIFPSGISNGRLPNKYITASSQWDKNHAPWLARLHRKRRGRLVGGWSARKNNRGQWIQFNLRSPKRVFKIVTQGRSDTNQWVKSFIIRYSVDGRRWVWYKRNSVIKVPTNFQGFVQIPWFEKI